MSTNPASGRDDEWDDDEYTDWDLYGPRGLRLKHRNNLAGVPTIEKPISIALFQWTFQEVMDGDCFHGTVAGNSNSPGWFARNPSPKMVRRAGL